MPSPDTRIRLILLDLDGTLADTGHANAQAYVAALREAGYALTEQEHRTRYFGMRCDEFLTRFGIADPDERERLRLRKIALYPGFFDSVRLNRPLWEFCRAFRAQGGRVWIVSTGSRANIDNVLRHLGIGGPAEEGTAMQDSTADTAAPEHPAVTDPAPKRASRTEHADTTAKHAARTASGDTTADAPLGRVDGILSGADVAHAKPAPDCFLEAMRREGCTPRETLVFEDSAVGLEAARRSGASYFKVEL